MLEINHLTVRVDGHPVVHDASLVVPTGSILGIAGSAPARRTGILLAIAGFGAREGRIRVDGRDAVATGLVTGEHVLIGSLTAFENVAAALFAAGEPARTDWARIEELLSSLHLPEASWHNLVENLSGGQQQRVALARALIVERGFVCLDAPVSELDGETTIAARARIREAADRGTTVVTTVGDADDGALCDEILVLSEA